MTITAHSFDNGKVECTEASAGQYLRRWEETGSYGDLALQKNAKTVMDKEVTNEEFLKRVGKERTLMKRIRKRQLEVWDTL